MSPDLGYYLAPPSGQGPRGPCYEMKANPTEYLWSKFGPSMTRTKTRTTEVTTIALRTSCSKYSSLKCQLQTTCQTFTKVILKCWFYSVLRPPSFFTGIDTNGSVSGTKTGLPREKHPTHPQAELGLSTLPERALHPQGDMVE